MLGAGTWGEIQQKFVLIDRKVLPDRHAQVIWPNYQPQEGLPPDKLGEGDGEHPADKPDDSHPGVNPDWS